jgi:multimeric flavodoxin WrbA
LKVLGIMGSPRIGGNTDLLLEEALKGASSRQADVRKIVADNLKISPCREYYACQRDGNCSIRDDMDDVYPLLLSTDVIIVASPIFFYGLSAQIKGLIDRCQPLWQRRYVLKNLDIPTRKGAFIAVGATKGKNLFEGSRLTVKYFFKAMNVEYADELLIRGVDQKGDIKKHPTALADAYELGKRLADAIRTG